MAAYTQQGVAVQTGGFGSVAPSAVDPNAAFDMLQKAFKTGLLQASEINNALQVVPAQQRAQVAAANDTVAEAEMNARLRPQIEPQKVKEAELRNQELQNKAQDPLGTKAAIAKKLAEFGLQPSGDYVKDAETLRKRSTASAEFLQIMESALRDGIVLNPNMDASVEEEVPRLRESYKTALHEQTLKKAEEEVKKEKAKSRAEAYAYALKNNVPPSPEWKDMEPEQIMALVAGEARNAEAAKEATKLSEGRDTEGQRKATTYVAEIEQSNKTLAQLEAAGITSPSYWAKITLEPTRDTILESGARAANDPKQVQWFDASDKWIEAVLRDRSGAAVPAKEYSAARRQYFPGPGATPAEISAKAELRGRALEAIRGTLRNRGAGVFYTPEATPVSGNLVFNTPATPAMLPPKVQSGTDRRTGQKVFYIPDPANPGKVILTDPAGVPLP